MLNAYGHLIVTLLSFGIAALFATIFLIELLALEGGFRLGARRIALTSLLLAMWAGGMAVTADLSAPRMGEIRATTKPLEWTVQGFSSTPAP